MAELCNKHKIVLSPDGHCVLCRRSASIFKLAPSSESWVSRGLTLILGAALLAALASLIVAQRPREAMQQKRAVVPNPTPSAAKGPAATTPTAKVKAGGDEHVAKPAERPKTLPPWKQLGVPRETFVAARGEVEVVMYAAPWCYICDGARTFLDSRGVTLVEHDIDMDPAAMRRLKALNSSASVPTFQLEGETIVGFNAWDLADRVDALAATKLVAGR